MPTFIFGSTDDLDAQPGPSLVLIEFSRHNIEAGYVSSAISRLYSLTDSFENIVAYQNCVSFTISGYDDDPRELPEIPEVRRFMRQVVLEWPHWIWFLVRGSGSIPLLMSLLCEVEIVRDPSNPGQFGTEFKSFRELKSQLRDLLARSERLLNGHALDSEMLRASRESAMTELGFGPS